MSDSNEQLQARIAELEAEVATLKGGSGGAQSAWAKPGRKAQKLQSTGFKTKA